MFGQRSKSLGALSERQGFLPAEKATTPSPDLPPVVAQVRLTATTFLLSKSASMQASAIVTLGRKSNPEHAVEAHRRVEAAPAGLSGDSAALTPTRFDA